MKQNSYNQSINFQSLFFYILKKWKSIIIFAFVVTVLSGFVYKTSNKNNNDNSLNEKQDQAYQTKLAQYNEQLQVFNDNLSFISDAINEQQEYLQNSELMKVNPFEQETAQVKIKLILNDPGEPAPANQILNVLEDYSDLLKSEELYSIIYEHADIDFANQYLDELVSLSINNSLQELEIEVVHYDENIVKSIIESILTVINGNEDIIVAQLPGYELDVIKGYTGKRVNLELGNLKRAQISNINSLLSNQNSAKKLQNDLVKPESKSKNNSLTMDFKLLLIISFTLGAFGAVAYCGLYYVLSDRVIDESELGKRFNHSVIRIFKNDISKKNLIDRWIYDKENKNKECERVETLEVAVLRMLPQLSRYTKVLIGSRTIDFDEMQDIVQEIKGYVSKTSVGIVGGSHWITDKNILNQSMDCEGIILIDKWQGLRYSWYEQTCGIAEQMEKTILGTIII